MPEDTDIAWCPGCGNFAILTALKQALTELDLDPTEVVMVSGIGQAAKIPQYVNTNYFNGLHGRALPPATAIKVVNPKLTVIAESGDGDMYGEGGNHLIHTMRRNPDITNIVHDNMIYGLTKGQASPTSQIGLTTKVQTGGVVLEPFNPIAVAIAMNASFVARAFAGDIEQTKELMMQAITHKGYALLDILQPCVSFNKVNTFHWFKDRIYYLEGHDPSDRAGAFELALEQDKLGLGIIYRNERPVFEEQQRVYKNTDDPLWKRSVDLEAVGDLINSFRK